MKTAAPFAIALITGVALAFGASLLTDRKDPFDAASYWWVIYPLSIAACAFLGYRYPAYPALWSLALFEGQFLGLILRHGEVSNLWPLAMAMLAVIAIPGIYAAKWAARSASAV